MKFTIIQLMACQGTWLHTPPSLFFVRNQARPGHKIGGNSLAWLWMFKRSSRPPSLCGATAPSHHAAQTLLTINHQSLFAKSSSFLSKTLKRSKCEIICKTLSSIVSTRSNTSRQICYLVTVAKFSRRETFDLFLLPPPLPLDKGRPIQKVWQHCNTVLTAGVLPTRISRQIKRNPDEKTVLASKRPGSAWC